MTTVDPEDVQAWIADKLRREFLGKPFSASAVKTALLDMLEPLNPHVVVEQGQDPNQLLMTVLPGATLQGLISPN